VAVSSATNVIEFPRRSSALDLDAFGDARQPTEECLQLARDLHDVVSYSFATISVQAGAALHRADERPELALEALEAIRSASKDALSEFRGLIGRLRRIDEPEVVSSPAGLGRLDALGATTTAAGVTTTVRIEGRPRPLPAAVDAAAYRIVQESLANVLRHADAASALVTIRYERDRLSLEVCNDGPSALVADRDRSDGSGHGIAGMRERAVALGGELDAGPHAEGGFRVRARLPILISL
jgi:signal transduction histidine kinase